MDTKILLRTQSQSTVVLYATPRRAAQTLTAVIVPITERCHRAAYYSPFVVRAAKF